jgi:hypothetical protein
MTYQYFVMLTADNHEVLYAYMGLQYLSPSNVKYMQIYFEQWLYKFMEKKQKDKYVMVTVKPKEVKKQKTSPPKAPPPKANPPKSNPPKSSPPKK